MAAGYRSFFVVWVGGAELQRPAPLFHGEASMSVKATEITKGDVWPGQPVPLFARIRNVDGALTTQASLTSITYNVFDLGSATPGTAIVSGATINKATAIFDSLQTADPRWTEDIIGYNFLFTMPANSFPLSSPGGRVYRVEITFNQADGGKFRKVYHPRTKPLLTSPL